MSDHGLEPLDDGLDDGLDDFVFEPDGWDMATDLGIGVDPETDRPALDELADAMLVSAEGAELERLTDEAVERIWSDELQELIREGLQRLGLRAEWAAAVEDALAEFDRHPRTAQVSREVVRHLALQLGHEDTPFFFCFDCLEEGVAHAPAAERRGLALRAAIVACRNAAVPEGSAARRRAVRLRLGRLGELGRESLPALAAELRAIAAEPLPRRAAEDDAWTVVSARLQAEVIRPELN